MLRWVLLFLLVFSLIEVFSIRPIPNTSPKSPHSIRGAIHVHSTFSDGGGSIGDIARIAKKAGLDFVLVTDHDTLKGKDEGREGTYDGVDVIVGVEKSLPPGHLLTFSNGKEFSIIPHPTIPKNPWHAPNEWHQGIELVNLNSEWQNKLITNPFNILITAMLFPVNETIAGARYVEIDSDLISEWDRRNQLKFPYVGTAGSDAHQKLPITENFALPWPRYYENFRIAQNILFFKKPLSKDFNTRRSEILGALENGHNAIGFTSVTSTEGNQFEIACPKQTGVPGDTLKFAKKCKAKVTIPAKLNSRALLYRNGVFISDIPKQGVTLLTPGLYRAQVNLHLSSVLGLFSRDIPYILYAPIMVQ